jgi:hypothetical protein
MDGKPTKENPIPVLHMGYAIAAATPGRRPLIRKSLNFSTEKKPACSTSSSEVDLSSNECVDSESDKFTAKKLDVCDAHQHTDECESTCCTMFPDQCKNRPTMVDSSTQTIDIVELDHNYGYTKKTRNASNQHSVSEFSAENVTTDSDSRFYTGLNLTVFLTLIATLSPHGSKLPFKLKVADQIFAVLVRLRLGLTYQDLARRLNVSAQLMSDMFNSWLDIMAEHLSSCVIWLPRETIQRTMPSSFKDSFPRTTCIIDCSEIFIQRPFKLKARAQTWSTYKNNNTAKFLVAIAPNGFIMFISKLYGGRASDVFITKSSGFLDYLLPGDEVMADRGFTISEELCFRRVKLNIPAFMKGRDQLSEQEVIDTRRIASDRIHVERAIMRIKSYRILNMKMSNKSFKKGNKTLLVVSALCNLRDPLIKDDCDENE